MNISEKIITIAENVPKVHAAGKKSEYDAFWDAFQDYGKRVDYENAFAFRGWTNASLKPKYKIIPTNANKMLMNNAYNGDITKIADIDLSNCTSMNYLLGYAYFITHFGVIDTRKLPLVDNVCYYARGLITIDKFIFKEDASQQIGSNIFTQCYGLKNIVFEGTIGQNIDLHWSTNLTKESISSIVSALCNNSIAQTLTLSRTAVNTAFQTSPNATDGSTSEAFTALVSTKPNWTFSLI